MQLRRIELENFRNYESAEFEFSENTNVICGENAQGKTNLLESIYILTGSKSFRTRFDRELISFDKTQARVAAEIFAYGREQKIELALQSGQRRKMLKNGVTKKKSELQSEILAVIFSPEDLLLVRDGAVARRRFIDTAMCQLRPKYGEYLRRYSKLYEHKSRILKDCEQFPELLKVLEDFSEAMAMCSAHIIRYRASFVSKLSQSACEIHSDFVGGREKLNLVYKTISTVTNPTASANELFEQIMEHQLAHRAAEMASHSCLTGIHRDDIEIMVDGKIARQFASQGQTRTAALSLKLAERQIICDETGHHPILLLDDVLSELDMRRQEFVLNRIGEGQCFISCCEDEAIAARTGARVIKIHGGRLV